MRFFLKVSPSIFVTTLLIVVSLFATSSWAQTKTINGGGAWVCRETEGPIRWAQVVDLYEADSEFGLGLDLTYTGTVAEIVDKLKRHLAQANLDLYLSVAPYFDPIRNLQESPPDVVYVIEKLEIVDPLLYNLSPSPKKCAGGSLDYEQVVNSQDNGSLTVQSEIFNWFPENFRVAFVLHEAVYAYLRAEKSAVNSMKARRIVGLVMSTLSIEELAKELAGLDEATGFRVGRTR